MFQIFDNVLETININQIVNRLFSTIKEHVFLFRFTSWDSESKLNQFKNSELSSFEKINSLKEQSFKGEIETRQTPGFSSVASMLSA